MTNSQILLLTRQLISIPSTSDNQKALNEALMLCKKELEGFPVKEFEKNGSKSLLFSNQNKDLNNFRVILNAHLDVVPAKDNQFNLVEKNGKLFGRGTNDMKAAAASMIILFKTLARKLPYAIGLQLVTDEEIGGFNGAKHQIEKGIRCDFVISGEPTNLGINNKAKGVIWIKIKSFGKTAHGAYLWNGKNAILEMNKFLVRLTKSFPVPLKESWETTVNVASVECTNKTFNKVPDDCSILLDVRYIPQDKDTFVERIKSLLPKDFTMETQVNEPSQDTDEDNEFIKLLKKSTKKITGRQYPVIVKHGAADVRHFNQIGCAGITFGPMGEGLHSDEEWVETEGLSIYFEILKDFLLSVK
ncbi:MAG: M20/M25/M40 family metallo-hydrolase [Candidatus Levybacteria bacterium]|nr:M20/M25/M40 family metallo-hydrolase [Candidatus Levybacteria bacterium]